MAIGREAGDVALLTRRARRKQSWICRQRVSRRFAELGVKATIVLVPKVAAPRDLQGHQRRSQSCLADVRLLAPANREEEARNPSASANGVGVGPGPACLAHQQTQKRAKQATTLRPLPLAVLIGICDGGGLMSKARHELHGCVLQRRVDFRSISQRQHMSFHAGDLVRR